MIRKSLIQDIDINRCARRVLVRHWVDLGRLSMRSISGALYVRGCLAKIAGKGTELSSKTVGQIVHELRMIRGVKRINIELTNWRNDAGGWVPLDVMDRPAIEGGPADIAPSP